MNIWITKARQDKFNELEEWFNLLNQYFYTMESFNDGILIEWIYDKHLYSELIDWETIFNIDSYTLAYKWNNYVNQKILLSKFS